MLSHGEPVLPEGEHFFLSWNAKKAPEVPSCCTPGVGQRVSDTKCGEFWMEKYFKMGILP